ncbi:hypothetical protein WG66_015562 [Moniliophthora roreri]|uniref:Uncharacterized protein n=1 Tax=Moniliophthora roreri TaxID=221103 RepID=A0A0W0FXX1_MONRR|nr:hypothetical protein WG66_015562 [Moniliophthora roreri]
MSLKESVSQHSANQILQTPPPPTLREILSAYRTKGDGDREMLLAMLNAKAAEDQRLAQTASLQRTMLEICQYSSVHPTLPPLNFAQSANLRYPSPSAYSSDEHPDVYHHRGYHTVAEPPRKKHRSSQSPYARPLSPRQLHRDVAYSGAGRSSPDVLPPSPYSEDAGSSSPPPSRSSAMGIGSLLAASRPESRRRKSPSRDHDSDSSS